MLDRMWNRSRNESGLTLIELLIVIIIFAIMFLIAMPAYLSFRVRANRAAAQSNLHNFVPGLIQWNGEHTDGYASVTVTKLRLSYNISIPNVSIFWPADDDVLPEEQGRHAGLVQGRALGRLHGHQAGRHLPVARPEWHKRPPIPPSWPWLPPRSGEPEPAGAQPIDGDQSFSSTPKRSHPPCWTRCASDYGASRDSP